MRTLRFLPLLLLSLICILPIAIGTAQEFSGGFRAGLNFISFSGDAESITNAMGEEMTLERFNRTTGFHVGATFAYEITDLFGFKADLMYSQKGGEVLFDGPSFFYLYGDNNQEQIGGQLQSERDVLNRYIDIPLVAYYRIGPLEIEGGVSAGFLVNSRATGSATYTGTVYGSDAAVVFNYDYNYLKDKLGNDAVLERAQTPLPRTQLFPPSVIDAYYNSENTTPLYERLDFGLVGGLSYFLNNGLYLGVRYQLGLTDTTRGENDQRLLKNSTAPGREYNTDDKDYNRSIQASVGFRF